MTIHEYAMEICKTLDNKKAEDILLIDIGDKSVLADYFVIASGRNNIHVKTLAEEVEEKLEESGFILRRAEGKTEGRWVVLDYGDVLVHLFHPEEREYYNIERLWADEGNAQRYPDSAESES